MRELSPTRTSRTLTLVAIAAGCSRAPVRVEPAAVAPVFVPRACASTPRAGAECGTVSVPENRADPGGRRIALNVVILRSPGGKTRDALYYFAGGPGQAATANAAMFDGDLASLRSFRDIVLVDQRGMGASNSLKCPIPTEPAMRGWLTGDFPAEELQKCAVSLDADPRFYTTDEAVRDADAVRVALGYDQFDTFGVSYGTRPALRYAALFPNRVRTVTLRGVFSPGMKLPAFGPEDAQRAFDMMLARCDTTGTCGSPRAEIRANLDTVMARAARAPRRLALAIPSAGKPDSLTISPAIVGASVLFSLYTVAWANALPAALKQAANGTLAPLLTIGVGLAYNSSQSMAVGSYLSIVCSEELPRIDVADFSRRSAGTFLGDTLLRSVERACAAWPHRPTMVHGELTRSSVPTLLISGDADPATAPRWAEEVRRGLPNGLHVVLPRTSHMPGVTPCVASMMERFLRAGVTTDLDTSCALTAQR